MERFYRRFARKLYRLLRHPRRRRTSRVHRWVSDRAVDRRMWVPEKHAVMNGLALGLFFAMAPPFYPQMITAVILCIWLRWNVPAAGLACWISNAATWVPQTYYQIVLGTWVVGLWGDVRDPISWGKLEQVMQVEEEGFFTRSWAMARQATDALEPYVWPWAVGILLSGTALAALGWLLGHALWAVFAHRVPVDHEVPHREEKQ